MRGVIILDFKESRRWLVPILSHWFQGFFSIPPGQTAFHKPSWETSLFYCSQISIPELLWGQQGISLKVEQVGERKLNSDMTGKCQRPFTWYHLRKRRQQRCGGKTASRLIQKRLLASSWKGENKQHFSGLNKKMTQSFFYRSNQGDYMRKRVFSCDLSTNWNICWTLKACEINRSND